MSKTFINVLCSIADKDLLYFHLHYFEHRRETVSRLFSVRVDVIKVLRVFLYLIFLQMPQILTRDSNELSISTLTSESWILTPHTETLSSEIVLLT